MNLPRLYCNLSSTNMSLFRVHFFATYKNTAGVTLLTESGIVSEKNQIQSQCSSANRFTIARRLEVERYHTIVLRV